MAKYLVSIKYKLNFGILMIFTYTIVTLIG